MAATATEKGLELSYLIAPDTPSMLVQDQTRLRQILVNLLSNAVKFTQQGEVVLSVESLVLSDGAGIAGSTLDPPPPMLHFSVRDTGIGIPADRMSRLFRSFSQVDAATARTYGGTGLGLAISKLLVNAMGGAMSVESVVGGGSTFAFSVVAPQAQGAATPAYESVHPDLRGRRALIVDDHETIRQSLATQLRSWGMWPTTAETGAAAIDLLRGGDGIDLAIIDMQMPEMSGATLAKAIRELRPAAPLPIILLGTLGVTTPWAGDPTTALLSKPVKLTKLYAQIIDLLSAPSAPAPAATPRGQPARHTAAAHAPMRILLAEDNLINQQLITRMLDRLGYKADVVANGRTAIEALRQHDYDLVLMDVQMPEMDGLEATRSIRAMRVGARQPWIIAVTAGSVQGDQEACFAAGMNDFVAKPVELELLARVLGRYQAAGAPQAQPVEPAPEPPPPEESQAPQALNHEVLKQLASTLGDQGDSLLPSLIRTFIEGADSLQASAREALGRGDGPTLRRTMHTLKSNANTFGAHPLAVLCRDLERLSAEGDLANAGVALDGVAAEFARVRAALDAR